MMDLINNSVAGHIKPARLDGEHRMVGPGDAILISPGAHHKPPWPP